MFFSDSSSICLSLTSYSALYSWKHVRPRFILGHCVVCLGKVHHDNCGESTKPGRSRWGLPSFALAKAATLWAMASSKPSRSMLLSSVRGKTGKPWETGLQPENHGTPWKTMDVSTYILITRLEHDHHVRTVSSPAGQGLSLHPRDRPSNSSCPTVQNITTATRDSSLLNNGMES